MHNKLPQNLDTYSNIYYLSVSAAWSFKSSLAEWSWLRLSHEIAVKMFLRAASPEALSGLMDLHPRGRTRARVWNVLVPGKFDNPSFKGTCLMARGARAGSFSTRSLPRSVSLGWSLLLPWKRPSPDVPACALTSKVCTDSVRTVHQLLWLPGSGFWVLWEQH